MGGETPPTCHLTAPILVSKDERTFGHLKFVKSVYRSTMGNKRLDNLMLL